MKRRRRVGAVLLFGALLPAGGCSFIMVDGPPPVPMRTHPVDCSTTPVWPIVDLVGAGLGLAGAIAAIPGPLGPTQDDPSSSRDRPLKLAGTMIIGLGYAALATTAAVVGFQRISECNDVMAQEASPPSLVVTHSPSRPSAPATTNPP